MLTVPPELHALQIHVRQINDALEDRSRCYYCGEPSACEDHVIPHALLYRQRAARKGYGKDTLPACTDCNALLGARVFDTLADRVAYLADTIRKRDAKHLAYKQWTESDLQSVSPTLQRIAIAANTEHARAQRRIAMLERREPIDPPVCTLPSKPRAPSAKPLPPQFTYARWRDRYKQRARKVTRISKWYRDEKGQWQYD